MRRIFITIVAFLSVAMLTLPASASSYIALGGTYRAFSSDPLWTAPDWQENLKGSLFLSFGMIPSVRINLAAYLGYGGLTPLTAEIPPAELPVVSISARAGIDYDLIKYEKDGTYVGFGPTAGISFGNVSFGTVTGKADFNIGAQVFFSALSGKVEAEGNISYTFRDGFVNGGLMLRYNPVGPLVLFTGFDYLRRDGFVSLGAGVKF